jgi:colanic acid/amylovoran biosynthesis glycosyltransferase
MPDQMTIGYVLKRFPRLSETFVLNEIIELERQGFRVEVFSLLRPPPEGRHALLAELKAKITYLPSSSSLERIRLYQGVNEEVTDLLALQAASIDNPVSLFSGKTPQDIASLHLKAMTVATLAQARGVDHLHAHFASDATTVALLAARMSGLPFSFTAHARDIYHTYTNVAADNEMRRAKIAEAAFVATVSDYNRAHLRRLAPARAACIHRLYNGIDLSRFSPNPSAAKTGLITAVGRLIEKKGFGDLISACAMLKSAGASFNCQIIGEGPLHDSLQNQISQSGLESLVEIVGPQPQEKLVGMMQKASIAVLPCIISESGDRDGLPTVLLEAMALGIPVVTTTVSGGPEIVLHGKTGLLVEPGDIADLAASIEALLQSPETMLRMGRAGRQRAQSLFSLTENVKTLSGYFARSQTITRTRLLEAV